MKQNSYTNLDDQQLASIIVEFKNIDTASISLGYDNKIPNLTAPKTSLDASNLVDYHAGPSYSDTRTFDYTIPDGNSTKLLILVQQRHTKLSKIQHPWLANIQLLIIFNHQTRTGFIAINPWETERLAEELLMQRRIFSTSLRATIQYYEDTKRSQE